MAVYLDDMMSGWTVDNNTFTDCQIGVYISGGRDNTLKRNYFENCDLAVHCNARGLQWERSRCFCDDECDPDEGKHCDCDTGAAAWLARVNPRIASRWPMMINQSYQCAPAGNTITDNSFCRSDSPASSAWPWLTF